jgi:hypothetical protein
MSQQFKLDELVQYLYNEVSEQKRLAIEAALEHDFELREKLAVMKTAAKRLSALSFNPRQETIDQIMQYAEKSVSETVTP